MLTIFLVIFGVIGLFLNWPILNEGVFKLFTSPLNMDQITLSFTQSSMGIFRGDGLLVVFTALVILITAFRHTTKTIINLRIFLLALNTAVLAAELFSVIKYAYPFYAYAGLLYSLVFLLLAFTAAVFRIGSIKSFNSTLMGAPMSESQVFSQSVSRLMGNITTNPGVRIKAADNIQPEFKKGEIKDFEVDEIRIGRDPQWANLLVGEEWDAVSGQHGILRAIGETIFFELLAGHYAFAVNGTPFKKSTEIKNNSEITLISGLGPKFTIERYDKNYSLIHPRTMVRAGEIARDEFKKLQSTFKILLLMAFLALPLLWFLLQVQKSGWENHLSGIKNKNEELNRQLMEQDKRIQASAGETVKKQTEIKALKKRIDELAKAGKTKEDQLQTALEKYRSMGGGESSGKAAPGIEGLDEFARVINIKFCTQRIGILFPFITVFQDGRSATGSAFFAKGTKGEPYILAEMAAVNRKNNSGKTYLFLYTGTWNNFADFYKAIKENRYSEQQLRDELKRFASISTVMEIQGQRWQSLNSSSPGKIAAVRIDSFPAYLRDDIPALDPRVELYDRAIFLGFREGRKFYSTGLVQDIAQNYIRTGNTAAANNDGGLLLKVLKEGRYAVIGILEPGGGKTGAKESFLKF